MDSRQRLLKTYNFEKPDRTPVTLFVSDTDIEDGPPNCVIGDRTDDVVEDLIRFHEVLGIDIMLRISIDVFEPIAFDSNGENWVNSWNYSEDGKRLVHTIATPEGRLSETFNLEGEEFHGDPTRDWMKLRNIRTDALIKGPAELELVKKYRPAIPSYDFSHIDAIQDRLGDRGIVLPRVPSSVFNSAFGLRKLEDLFTDPILQPDLYKELMELCTEDAIAVGMQVLKAGGDVMRVVGNVANSGMVGSDFYMEQIFGYEKRYIDALSGNGGKVLVHNCGQSFGLLQVYRQMLDGLALESLATPSAGGDVTDLRAAREMVGDNVVMVGNFDQVHLLREGSAAEIKQGVKGIFEQAGDDPAFIFSTSDSIVPGTPKENIEVLCEAALACAG